MISNHFWNLQNLTPNLTFFWKFACDRFLSKYYHFISKFAWKESWQYKLIAKSKFAKASPHKIYQKSWFSLQKLTARGKPSTWFPRGRLVEQSRQDKTQKRRQKARTEKENPPATAAAHKKSPPRPRLFRGELLFAAHCWYLWPALPVPLPLPFCPPHFLHPSLPPPTFFLYVV